MNRCLTEGRRAFLEGVAGIETGSECERLAPVLSRLADGEATAEDRTALRPHIRGCLACRAVLREFRAAPRTAAALVPAAAFAAADRSPLFDVPARLVEGVTGWTQKAHAAVEMASAQKVAAVAASTAVLAGGGAAVTVERVERRPDRPEQARHAKREQRPPALPAPTVRTAPAATPVAPPPASTQPSLAARRAQREAKAKTPPAQQEFEPAWAAGEPDPATETATASTSVDSATSAPAPKPTRSGGGAEEFAP